MPIQWRLKIRCHFQLWVVGCCSRGQGTGGWQVLLAASHPLPKWSSSQLPQLSLSWLCTGGGGGRGGEAKEGERRCRWNMSTAIVLQVLRCVCKWVNYSHADSTNGSPTVHSPVYTCTHRDVGSLQDNGWYMPGWQLTSDYWLDLPYKLIWKTEEGKGTLQSRDQSCDPKSSFQGSHLIDLLGSCDLECP